MISFGAAGAPAYSASGGTSITVPYPTGITAGQLLILIVGQKPSTANGGSITTPTDWTFAGGSSAKGGYGSTLGASTGNTNLIYHNKLAVGSETGNLVVTVADNGVAWAQMLRFTATSGWSGVYNTGGSQDTVPSSPLIVTTTDLLAPRNQDMVVGAMVTAFGASGGAPFSDITVTGGGLYIPITEVSQPSTATGTDVGGVVVYGRVGNGTATTVLTWQSTITGTLTNVRGPVHFLVLRGNTPDAPASVDKVAAAETLLAENPAYPMPAQKLAAVELLLVETYVPPPTNDAWVWDGTTEVPANATVWDGTAEVALDVSIT